MDVWEANSASTAYTSHACSVDGQYRCSGTQCGDPKDGGVCDKDGCDFNPYRVGDTTFYGKGLAVDTTKKMTVVTQFNTVDGTDTGALSEIRRIYVQNGVIIQNAFVNIPNVDHTDNSITSSYCNAQKSGFGNTNDFATLGGLAPIDKALSEGVVLVMSISDDYATNLLWLDGNFPASGAASTPGVARGSCATTSGVPSQVEAQFPDSSVTYSNIKFGPIGSTQSQGTTTNTRSRRSGSAPHGSRVRRSWLDRTDKLH
jgi:cellulose 1,4-beta-cellobiosidase